jgi:hypothetical protein
MLHNKYDLKYVYISDEEIENDLIYIRNLCKSIFNENTELHIIPHLNLKSKALLDYIDERNTFVILLEHLCKKYDVFLHNVGKYIESLNGDTCFIEDYMADSCHYSKDYGKVKLFLINEIIQNKKKPKPNKEVAKT